MKIRSLLAAAAFLGSLVVGVPGKAAMMPITVVNPSFEDDFEPEDGNVCFGAGCISPPWADGNDTGLYNPINFAGFNEPVPDGENVAFSNQAGISQVLAETLKASTIYTLSVDVGAWNNPAGNPFPSQPEIQLWNGNTSIEHGAVQVSTPVGEFTTNTLLVQTGDNPPGLDEPIQIILAHNSGSSPFSQVWWDNVRLYSEPAVVPLPAALPLFLFALAGLGFIVKRRKQTA